MLVFSFTERFIQFLTKISTIKRIQYLVRASEKGHPLEVIQNAKLSNLVFFIICMYKCITYLTTLHNAVNSKVVCMANIVTFFH